MVLSMPSITTATPWKYNSSTEVGLRSSSVTKVAIEALDFDWTADHTFQENIELRPTDTTYTSDPGSTMQIDGTYTVNFANAVFGGVVNSKATVNVSQNANLFGLSTLFTMNNIFKNTSGQQANLGPVFGFLATSTMRADGKTITQNIQRDFVSQSKFDAINGGSLTTTEWTHYLCAGQIISGSTVTTRTGLRFLTPTTTTGTLTNNIGIDIEDQSFGTNRIGIRSAMGVGSTKYFIQHNGAAQSVFGGVVEIGNDGNLVLDGVTGQKVTYQVADGTNKISFAWTGGTNNENFLMDLEGTANQITTSSTSGVTIWDYAAMTLRALEFRADGDSSAGVASTNQFTGVTDTPTTDPGWATSSSVDMNAPNGYIKAYVGTQAVTIPFWDT